MQKFPINTLKIDQSFIRNMLEDRTSMELVKSIISLGKNMNMTITAEGVEQEEVLACLREEGCGQGQGYLFGKAMPGAEIVGPERVGKVA